MNYWEFLAWILDNVDHGTGIVLDKLRQLGWPLSAAIEWIRLADHGNQTA